MVIAARRAVQNSAYRLTHSVYKFESEAALETSPAFLFAETIRAGKRCVESPGWQGVGCCHVSDGCLSTHRSRPTRRRIDLSESVNILYDNFHGFHRPLTVYKRKKGIWRTLSNEPRRLTPNRNESRVHNALSP